MLQEPQKLKEFIVGEISIRENDIFANLKIYIISKLDI